MSIGGVVIVNVGVIEDVAVIVNVAVGETTGESVTVCVWVEV